MISYTAFGDELIKIAEAEQIPINKATFKKFLENTAFIAAGTAAGYGAGELTRRGLAKVVPGLSPRARQAILAGTTLLGGTGVALLKRKMDQEKNRRLEEAYRKGLMEAKSGR